VLALMLALEECQGAGMVRSHISDENGCRGFGKFILSLLPWFIDHACGQLVSALELKLGSDPNSLTPVRNSRHTSIS
jgi:hypothetical protein